MYELKKMERYLRVNLLGPGPRLTKKKFTRPWSHKDCSIQTMSLDLYPITAHAKLITLGCPTAQ